MQRDLDKMRRRPFFFPLILPVLLFIAVVAAGAWLFDARADDGGVRRCAMPNRSRATTGSGPQRRRRERAARLAKMLSQAQPVRGVDASSRPKFRRPQQTVDAAVRNACVAGDRRSVGDVGRPSPSASRASTGASMSWRSATRHHSAACAGPERREVDGARGRVRRDVRSCSFRRSPSPRSCASLSKRRGG